MASRSTTAMYLLTAFIIVGAVPLLGMNPTSCDRVLRTSESAISPDHKTISLKVGDKQVKLELALDFETRMKGLGQRDKIADDGGMMFVFPDTQVRVQGFLMRDCPVPIDILYLDGSGRVLTWYEMKPEPPRGEGEGKPGRENNTDAENDKYERRLPQYSSRYPAQFVLEFKGGTLAPLNLKEGAKIDFDGDALKKLAK